MLTCSIGRLGLLQGVDTFGLGEQRLFGTLPGPLPDEAKDALHRTGILEREDGQSTTTFPCSMVTAPAPKPALRRISSASLRAWFSAQTASS